MRNTIMLCAPKYGSSIKCHCNTAFSSIMLFNNKLSFWYNDKKVQVFNTIMYLKLTHGKHSY